MCITGMIEGLKINIISIPSIYMEFWRPQS